MPRPPKKGERRADVAADSTQLSQWIVSLLRHKGEQIAITRAKDAAGAVAAIVKEKAITDPEVIRRLAARPA